MNNIYNLSQRISAKQGLDNKIRDIALKWKGN